MSHTLLALCLPLKSSFPVPVLATVTERFEITLTNFTRAKQLTALLVANQQTRADSFKSVAAASPKWVMLTESGNTAPLEYGFVNIHAGSHGVGDIKPELHHRRNPAAKMTIRRIH